MSEFKNISSKSTPKRDPSNKQLDKLLWTQMWLMIGVLRELKAMRWIPWK